MFMNCNMDIVLLVLAAVECISYVISIRPALQIVVLARGGGGAGVQNSHEMQNGCR